MVFNATFNNISVISWRSVLLAEETGENHRPAASHWQILSHNVVSSTPRNERDSNSQYYSNILRVYQRTWYPVTIYYPLDIIFGSISASR